MDLRCRQRLGLADNTGDGVIARRTQVQGQRGVHTLGVLGKPQAQLMGHLAHHAQVTGQAAFAAFAHYFQNHKVLAGVAVARCKAGIQHPLVLTIKVLLRVVDQRGPAGQQGVVRGGDRVGQQFYKFLVGNVHERHFQRERFAPLQRGVEQRGVVHCADLQRWPHFTESCRSQLDPCHKDCA